ncbi:MAG: ABC transporter ATP-binding protein [Pelagimonas sp.]|uniref:iron ABC transporter ATP-binding protein n=1 Tax=Pelagimonas sp. TaxID=2073170 RepID=UPI003D6BC6A8
MISVTGLSYHYGSVPILRDISLDIPRGGVTALVGPNGAGKSTLLGLIARLMPLQSGRVIVDDLNVATTPSDVLARKLAILPQASDVATRLTVGELISFGRYPHHKGRPTEQDRAKIKNAVETFELSQFVDRTLDSLSGGQRQRAQVAMTFAQDTDFVLLDEPLNNLDIAASRSLMKLLRRVAHEHNRTVVTVLHDINYACAYADHMVTIKSGQLGPAGVPSDVVSNDMLKSVFNTDAQVVQTNGRTLVQV